MLKKIREFFQKKDSEKGQGVVEYALVLGVVAVLAVYLLSGSDIKTTVIDKGVGNAGKVATAEETALTNAADPTKKTNPLVTITGE